jgi:hypothetical protein
MYAGGKGVGVVVATATTGTAAITTLPNTGGNLLVSAALAVGAGLLTWGVLYTRGR